jgi:hypothetical protein
LRDAQGPISGASDVSAVRCDMDFVGFDSRPPAEGQSDCLVAESIWLPDRPRAGSRRSPVPKRVMSIGYPVRACRRAGRCWWEEEYSRNAACIWDLPAGWLARGPCKTSLSRLQWLRWRHPSRRGRGLQRADFPCSVPKEIPGLLLRLAQFCSASRPLPLLNVDTRCWCRGGSSAVTGSLSRRYARAELASRRSSC